MREQPAGLTGRGETPVTVTLDWLGCATYRLSIDGLVIFLDTFMDRTPTAPDVGLTSADVTEADYLVIGHSHWDHIAGADMIAKNTGAKVIGSFETARVLREAGVPDEQLLATQGGERFDLDDRVSVRTFPSLHSCIWSRAARPGIVVTGDHGVPENERAERLAANRERRADDDSESGRAMRELLARSVGSSGHGGAIDYLFETPDGSILFQDSMGYWTGVLQGIHADVAILAAAGRGNIDGEPVQGAVEDFIAREVDLIQPRKVVLGHHDNFMGAPDQPDVTDMTPVHEELARLAPNVEVIEMELAGSVQLF